MNYWLTTQWPLEKDQTREWAVWLPDDGRQQAGSALQPDDEVIIYESGSGRARLHPQTREPIRRRRGLARIIGAIRLSEALRERTDAIRHDYDDGSRIRWGYRAAGTPFVEGGFVPRKLMNTILGFKENYNLHGFGDRHSGLKRLTVAQYRSLIEAYVQHGGTLIR